METAPAQSKVRAFIARHRYPLQGALFAAVFVIGVFGWQQTDPSIDIIEAAYRSLALFPMAAGGDPSPSLLLNIARFAAPILLGSAVLAVTLQVILSQRALSRAQRLKGSSLILGEGSLALEIVGRHDPAHEPVLFVGSGPSDILLPLRKAGLVHLEAVDDPTLGKLVQRAKNVIIASDTDSATAARAKRVREVRRNSMASVRILFEDPSLATAWLRQDHEHVISIPMHLATSLLRQEAPDPDRAVAPPPLVIGDGRIAAALARRIVTAWHQPGEPMVLYVAGRDRTWVDDALAGLDARVDLHWHEQQPNPIFAARLLKEIQQGWTPPDRAERYVIEGSTVFIAYEDETASAPLALMLSRQLSDIRIVCVVDDPSLWYRDPDAASLTFCSAKAIVADPRSLSRDVNDDLRDEIANDAAKWPKEYRSPIDTLTDLTHGKIDVPRLVTDRQEAIFEIAGLALHHSTQVFGGAFVATPEQLDALARGVLEALGLAAGRDVGAARLAALDLAVRLPTLVARTGVQVSSQPAIAPPFGEPEIDLLARAAHEAYLTQAQAAANATESVNAGRTWEELPDFERRSNVAQVLDIPFKLASVGMTMKRVGSPGVHEFTRDEVEFLAQQEHRRWEHFQIRNGRRGHEFNRPWEELAEEVRDYDRSSVRNIPRMLARVGIEIAPLRPAPRDAGSREDMSDKEAR